MRKLYIICITLLCLLTLAGCVSSRMYKKGTKLETVGQYAQAAEFYRQAIDANNANADAYVGLKRTGQKTLDKKLAEFNEAYKKQDDKNGVYLYQDARNYYEKLKKYSLDISIPSYYEDYYTELKDSYIHKKYNEGCTFLSNEDYSQAKVAFEEVSKLNPEYKETKNKLVAATYEPIYREGISLMDNGKYRQAYTSFETITNNVTNYESAKELQAECLEKGTIIIGIRDVTGNGDDVKTMLKDGIITKINEQNNKFIQLTSYDANKKMNAVLTCSVSKYNYNAGSLTKEEMKGYNKTTKTKTDEDGKKTTETSYSKVTYIEYKMKRSIDITYNYKLTDMSSGNIVASETKSQTSSDEINYIKYDGNINNLVGGYWENKLIKSSKDYVNDNSSANSKLKTKANARKEIKTYESIRQALMSSVSSDIAKAVENYVSSN